MQPASFTRQDFEQGPMIVFYEMTRACDLACVHCRADAQRTCDPGELTPADARRLVDQLLDFPKPPMLVLTGGDPLKRADVFDLVEYAVTGGVATALTPSATPLVTSAAVRRLKAAGLHRLAVSLDAANATTHDSFRRVPGSYLRTLEIIDDCHAAALPFQVNTTIGRHNIRQLEEMAELVSDLGAVLWSVFFIVPTGRATADLRLAAAESEEVFDRLWALSRKRRMPIKTTEAPHYRRFVLQRLKGQRGTGAARSPSPPAATNDGKGIMFVSHVGEIFPSGFLPIPCGRFPIDSLARVYQQSALFRALRDADKLAGKCGKCEFRHVCGGSRARAFALTADPLAAEPDCIYEPAAAVSL